MMSLELEGSLSKWLISKIVALIKKKYMTIEFVYLFLIIQYLINVHEI